MTESPLRIGLIGAGAIGGVVGRALIDGRVPGARLCALMVRDAAEGRTLAAAATAAGQALPVHTTREGLLAERPQLVVEAAGQPVIAAHGPALLQAGCDLLLASVGALADDALRQALAEAATAAGRQVLLPAGALGGLDLLAAAQLAGLQRVVYRGRKPPLAWRGTPAEAEHDLGALQRATCLFRGSAREAAQRYPKNSNVAATLALATLGLDAVAVELWADPAAGGNVHEVEAQGAAGHWQMRLHNAPSPDNPKTSLITPYSLLAVIARRCAAMSF